MLAVTLPVKCKVKRTNGKACKRWAYGFLFGCYDVPDHWKEKFKARLHLTHEEEEPVARRLPAGSVVMRQVAPPSSKPIKVTVEDGFRGICGFWIAVASLIATVVQTVTGIVH